MATFDGHDSRRSGHRFERYHRRRRDAELGAGPGQRTGRAAHHQHPTDVTLSGPLSPIFNSVTINGNNHTIDAGGTTRIFMVGVDLATINDPAGPVDLPGSIIAERPQVAINAITLANGLAHGGAGSGGGGPVLRCARVRVAGASAVDVERPSRALDDLP